MSIDRYYEMIVEMLGVKIEEITDQSNFFDDLGADSLDLIELVMYCEEEFNVSIPDEQAEKIKTVLDLKLTVSRLEK